MKEKHVKMKKSYNDKIFDIINVLLMCILVVIFVWNAVIIEDTTEFGNMFLSSDPARKQGTTLFGYTRRLRRYLRNQQ